MTREAAIKWAKEIKAFQEGKTIQLLKANNEWMDLSDPAFQYYNEYRIKPEPTKRLPTIEEVEKWFIENKVFCYRGNVRTRISHIDLRESEKSKCINIADTWTDIETFVKNYTNYDGTELYITEN